MPASGRSLTRDGWDESWRIAEEGEPPAARRCSCPAPVVDRDADGWALCLVCGHEPSVRLPAAARCSQGAPDGLNGEPACDPSPDLVRESRNGARPAAGRSEPERSVRSIAFHPLSMSNQKHIGFVVPGEMAAALEAEAARHDRSVSATLRQMVRAHLENESARPAEAGRSQSRAMTEPASGKV